jgi:hypothetical protein
MFGGLVLRCLGFWWRWWECGRCCGHAAAVSDHPAKDKDEDNGKDKGKVKNKEIGRRENGERSHKEEEEPVIEEGIISHFPNAVGQSEMLMLLVPLVQSS